MFKVLFFVFLNACVFGGFSHAGGNLNTMWQPGEVVIIGGAGFFAMLISAPAPVMREMLAQLKQLLSGGKEDPQFYQQLCCLCYVMFNQLKQKGWKVLDEHVDNPAESTLFQQYPAVLNQPDVIRFLADNLRIQSMAKIAPHDLSHLMEEEIERQEADLMRPSETLYKIGDSMPGFGVMAAVMGIIIAMGYLDGALSKIGMKVASALVGTFIGVYICYALMHPLSAALDHMVQMRVTRLKVLEKMIAYFAKGKPPMLAIDAGRRQIQQENRPSFIEVERWLTQLEEKPGDE